MHSACLPLHKDDTLFRSGRPTGLNIYACIFQQESLPEFGIPITIFFFNFLELFTSLATKLQRFALSRPFTGAVDLRDDVFLARDDLDHHFQFRHRSPIHNFRTSRRLTTKITVNWLSPEHPVTRSLVPQLHL
ncbi:hypothetical protein C8R45DRAFT_827290 [Mycena sanguinolenta]|nr:hypothetical protein C8R45DRAFT_827290 [Mycena sanguinolenta]